MKFFRSHILRLSGLFMVLIGMMVYHLKPLDTEAPHSDFTNWLERYLKDPDAEIVNKLRGLSAQEKELDAVIREASELISDHRDDFNLPVSQSEQDNTPYQILLTQWKNYQHAANGMGKAVLTQHVKTNSILPDHVNPFHYLVSAERAPLNDPLYGTADLSCGIASNSPFTHSPHLSGQATNAP